MIFSIATIEKRNFPYSDKIFVKTVYISVFLCYNDNRWKKVLSSRVKKESQLP